MNSCPAAGASCNRGLLSAGALTLPPSGIAVAGLVREFGWKEDFLLDGEPFAIRGGEMHYSRIPPGQWRARLRMLRAMDLNAVGSYVFWNLHEPRPGEFDFAAGNGSVRGLAGPVFATPGAGDGL